MVYFKEISLQTFLKDYWQKKPLLIRNALPNFINPLSPDELAGLALEDDIESRIVRETPNKAPIWHLQNGPFKDCDFSQLPSTHWTLLVQGVDRIVPEVSDLLNHFDFLPQWRIDDVMISFAALHGSVGPHYDNYDVFLYQAMGRREWSLTTEKCNTENYLENLDLRIMREFNVEERLVLEEGDMLYLPPHVGHHGVSLSEQCMTYSFGYRSYQGQEVWDSLGDYLSEKECFTSLYKDPDWSELTKTSEIPDSAWKNAQQLLLELVEKESVLKAWFGCFATRLDQEAERQLPLPLENDELVDINTFIELVNNGMELERNPNCRFAYQQVNEQLQLYINGCEWDIQGIPSELVELIANNRLISSTDIIPYFNTMPAQQFLFDLWTLQWLESNIEI